MFWTLSGSIKFLNRRYHNVAVCNISSLKSLRSTTLSGTIVELSTFEWYETPVHSILTNIQIFIDISSTFSSETWIKVTILNANDNFLSYFWSLNSAWTFEPFASTEFYLNLGWPKICCLVYKAVADLFWICMQFFMVYIFQRLNFWTVLNMAFV